MNQKENTSIPTIIAGDLNRFFEEKDDFQKTLFEYNLKEAKSNKLVIPSSPNDQVFNNEEDIGTFNPWPTDERIYNVILNEPLGNSRLDVQLCTNNADLINVKDVYTRASMYRTPGSNPPVSSKEGLNHVRKLLHYTMTSDHLAIVGEYEITG